MTIREAYLQALARSKIILGRNEHHFSLVGWKSPDNEREHGPFLVMVDGDTAIEVSSKGEFLDSFPAVAEHYFPWIKS